MGTWYERHGEIVDLPTNNVVIFYRYVNVYQRVMTDWWFGTMEFYDLPFSWECQNPN